ncbi:hypothetical protein B5M09_007126, partial [Aphanomyces astaci]
MPLTAASLAAHIMTHVDRLGRACMPQDNVQLLEKLRHVYLHPTSTPPAMAYAVDVSNETFLTLVDIITTTLGLDPVESKQSSVVKTTNQLTTNLLVTSLRLVQVNLYRLLTCPKLAPPVVHKLFILLRELATLPVADDTQEISQCAADALKDYVMVDLMARLFSKTHTCDVAASEIASAWDKDSLTYMDLMALMTRLVKQCADTDNTDPRLQLQLKLVAVLQSHVFAAWNPSMYCTRCINRMLGSYLEGLLGEGLSLLRKVHKGLLKGNDVSQLRPSFFHVLVPLAIECIQVTTPLRSNMALAKTLLPLLLPMLKLVDEITYKIIQFVCRHGPFLQAADPHDDLLRTWESNHPTTPATVSLPQLVTALSRQHFDMGPSTTRGTPLKIIGLSILHDSLCKLTSSSAKCELLRAFIEPVECGGDMGGWLTLTVNAWQEPKVEFHRNAVADVDDVGLTPLQVLEQDMHTQYGVAYHSKLSKAFENLYIRLAKIVASPESSLLLKKRALNLWRQLLQHEAAHVALAASPPLDILDDAISSSTHGVPSSSCLAPRLRPVEKLVYMATSRHNVHQACWHVFSWLCKQFMTNEQFMANDYDSAMSSDLRPSSSAKAVVCASPRKRLTLPPKLIVSTMEESFDHMVLVLLQEAAKIKDALTGWNHHATELTRCVNASHVLLLADPYVVSSAPAIFTTTSPKEERAHDPRGWTVCMWIHVDEIGAVPVVLVANGDAPLVTLEHHGYIGLTWNDSMIKVVSTGALKRRGWTHVACNFFPDKAELYLNGVLDTAQVGQHYHVVMHPTFTVGGLCGDQSANQPEHHSSSHILLDDVTVHYTPLNPQQIGSLAAAGSLLFRIKQRQLLDQHCTSLLSLLAWLATVKAPRLFDRDGGGVVTWLGLDGPLKAKSSSMLRAARSSLVDSFVTLFRALLLSPTWTPELLSKFAGHSPETILVKMGDTMHGLLEWVLQHPLSIDGHGTTFMQDMDEDIQIAIYMHIRASLLRLAMAQTLHPCVARTMLSHESVVTELLAVAVRPVQSSLEDVFGNELDVVSKLDNVQGLVDWIADDNNSNMTESVTKKRAILDRLPYVRGADVTPWWVVSAAQSLHVLGGEVEVDEYCVKGLLHFPTVKLNGVSVTAGSGMWYYEVVLLSDGLMQWQSGDVVGVLLDTDRCEMHYFLNGRSLGIAFEGLRLNHPVYPAMSLNVDQSVQFHFTASQFLYLPAMDKIQPVSSAILGHMCEHNTESGAIAWIMEQMEQEGQAANPTDKKASTFVLELADTCRDEEILPLYLIAETARSKWCAQDTLNQMLVHSTTPSPAAFPHGPFLAFVQSVIVGRSTDDDVDMKDSHLGANYTRLLHAMCAKNAGFVSILVDEMLRHFTLACDKDYCCWLARVLFAFAHNDNAAEANAVIRASNVWPTLVKAATNCNATLRHRAITVMTWYLQQDGLVGESGVPCLRFEYFVEWLAARVRKESPMRVVYSDYTQVSYTFSDLEPDTLYSVRAILTTAEPTGSVTFETLCESHLELDASSMGANLELVHHNMTVRNRVNKKWNAVRASVAYTSGVHVWDVRIDKCVSKNIFVGICTADASMENYVGSDA